MGDMAELILLRHGESLWNKLDIFTGWVDVPLSKKGIEEAIAVGEKIQNKPIDAIFTSTLIRAKETIAIAMAYHHSNKVPVFLHKGEGKLEEWGKIYGEKAAAEVIPVFSAWQLNERMYGALQGMNKKEMAKKYGEEQVKKWRRSFAISPPEGESLKTCSERTIPYFQNEIIPFLEKGQTVLISAHGNSLRSIIMMIEKLTEEEIVALELTLGEPIYYKYEDRSFHKLGN